MHFLAHLYLSGESSSLIVGNFIGEIKTITDPSGFRPDIQEGILLQKLIDEFTNQHEAVIRSRERLNSKYSKYSDFIIDVFYDHFLALNWEAYSSVSLEEFTCSRYDILVENMDLMPYKAKGILPVMAKSNWMNKFRTIGGVHQTIKEMDMRSTKLTHTLLATEDLLANYKEFVNDFNEFFPSLIEFVNERVTLKDYSNITTVVPELA